MRVGEQNDHVSREPGSPNEKENLNVRRPGDFVLILVILKMQFIYPPST